MDILKTYPQIKELQKLAKCRKAEVHLVGGFLRDHLLKRENHDLDFAVSRNAVKFAESFAEAIKGAFVLLDKEHGCARVVKKVKGVPYTFDFADFRGDSIADDIKHRDFTINTLTVDVSDIAEGVDLNDIITDRKRAIKDITGGRIKRVSISAVREDPLRIMRAFALRATLDFRIDLSTLNQIRKEGELIRPVSAERIRDELFKILESPFAHRTLMEMDKAKFLEVIIPQIRVMFQCPQGGYHHLDVWPHSLEVVKQLEILIERRKGDHDLDEYLGSAIGGGRSRKALLKLGALLHDIGKPDTRKKEGERYSFHSHEHVGADITKIIAKNLKLSVNERRTLEDYVRCHLRPGYLSNFKRPSERAYFRYFRDTQDEAAAIALLAWADQRSTRGPLTSEADHKHHQSICEEVIKRYFEKLKEEPFVPLITGDDLISKLKLKPSPLFGKILTQVEEQQALGKISDKDSAIKLARELAEKS